MHHPFGFEAMLPLAVSSPAPAQNYAAICAANPPSHARSCHGLSPVLSSRLGPGFRNKSPLVAKLAIGGRSFKRQSFQVFAAEASVKIEKWVLQPIGDGNSSHLDEAVPLPGAFEVLTAESTVGRLAEKVDIVIPVATVSGVHARLEKKNGTLFVTDLNSTNGTYVNDKRIRAGAVTPIPPGGRVTFGDDHLAAFKFSKVEEEMPSIGEGTVPLKEEEGVTSVKTEG